MNRLKSKASRLFRNTLSQDERMANASPSQEVDFNAGIECGPRKKPSRFFSKNNDKPLPATPVTSKSLHSAFDPWFKDDLEVDGAAVNASAQETAVETTNKPLPSRPGSIQSISSQARSAAGKKSGTARNARPAELEIRKRPSFATLRKSSSRIFRTATCDHNPPPPPVPQIPIDTPTPKPRRPILGPLESVRSGRPSQSASGRAVSISRPVSSAQSSPLPAVFSVTKVPFIKPSGPPPPRPPRPNSIDYELVALSRDYSTRMMLRTPNRVRTPTVSTSSSARSRALTRVRSEEACARLGFPSGHSSVSTPRSLTFDSPLDSPLAAHFPLDPSKPLPFRDSSGSVKGYGRFSAYIKARQGYKSGAYEDGLDREDRELGPVEMYRKSKCGDWTLERRVSGRLGDRWMLFRDRWGGWHFVADI